MLTAGPVCLADPPNHATAQGMLDGLRSIPLTLKAVPRVEGGQRIVYIEPSNETTDLEGERVLREALKESKDYFLAKGNFDLDHITIKGYSMDIANPRLFELGRPTEVRFDANRTFVKGVIYKGLGEVARRANEFWESMTELTPPMKWFPSVGGHVREAGTIAVNGSKDVVKAIKKVYWNNIGFSREPVNPTVPNISVLPIGAFAKSWVGIGSQLQYTQVEKAITAGYGSDVAALTGGGALRTESLDHTLHAYQPMTQLAHDMELGKVLIAGDRLVPADLLEHLIEHMALDEDRAMNVLRQFLYSRILVRKAVLTES